jgi:hydrogenase-4 component F
MIYWYFILVVVFMAFILMLKSKKMMHYTVYVFCILQIAFVVFLFKDLNHNNVEFFNFDSISVLFAAILSVIGFMAAIHYQIYEQYRGEILRTVKIHNAVFIGFNAALIGVYLSSQYGLLWAFVEATTLTGATLIYHDRKSIVLEAVWKYVFACSVSITLAFVGILLLSVAAQEVGLKDLSFALLKTHAMELDPIWLKSAFIFILVGFSVKMGIIPMFNVDIDAKDVAPSPVSALFSTVVLNAGFLAIYRFYSTFSETSIGPWMDNVLLICGISTLFFAAAYLMRINNCKRLFAYSSMEHAGLIIIALSLGKAGMFAAFLHLTYNSIVKSGLFFQVGQMIRINGWNKIGIRGYFYQNPIGGLILLFGSIAIMGMPPSGIFISELLIFKALILQKHWLLILAVLFPLIVIFYVLIRAIFKILFHPIKQNVEVSNLKGHPVEYVLQIMLLGTSMYFGLFQNQLLFDLIQAAIN